MASYKQRHHDAGRLTQVKLALLLIAQLPGSVAPPLVLVVCVYAGENLFVLLLLLLASSLPHLLPPLHPTRTPDFSRLQTLFDTVFLSSCPSAF